MHLAELCRSRAYHLLSSKEVRIGLSIALVKEEPRSFHHLPHTFAAVRLSSVPESCFADRMRIDVIHSSWFCE